MKTNQKFNKAFWNACASGNFATVCAEIEKGVDINYQNGDGRTGLMRAAKHDYKDIVRVLLDNGAEINLEDNKEKTAIMGAMKKGNRTICKKLIEAGANVDTSDDRGRAASMCVAFLGHDRCIEVLLNIGAEVSTQDGAGRSALIGAYVAFRKDVIHMLIERNADVNLYDNNGCMVLVRAVYGGYVGLVEDPPANDVDRDLIDKEGHKAIHYICEDCLARLKPILKQEVTCIRDYLSHEVRNVVVLGHSGIGKITVTEGILYFTKASDRSGVTSEGSSLIGCDPEEMRCGVFVYASLVPIEWEDCKINFTDTPGCTDFTRDAEVEIAAGGSALTVVDAEDAVQPRTIKTQEAVQRHSIPTIFFVNKLDEDSASFDQARSALWETFGKNVTPFEVPIMENGKTIGSVNILCDKVWYLEGLLADPNKAQPVPEDMTDIVTEYKNQIAGAIAVGDDELVEKYFSSEELSKAELTRGIHLGMRSGEIRPVPSGSTTHSVGVRRLMNLIVKYFPACREAGSTMVSDAETKESVMLEINEEEALCAQVFKTVVDPFVGRVSYIKVLAGVMSSDSVVYSAAKDQVEKISTISTVKGKHRTVVGKLFTSDIGAAVKLQAAQTDDTSCRKRKHYLVEPIQFSEPMLGMAVSPDSKSDEDKMNSVLVCMMEEDPTLRLGNNEGTKQTVPCGIGDQHIDVVLNKLRNKYKVEMHLETPKIPYHETIWKTAIGEGRRKKQSDGYEQFGHVSVELASNPNEEGMVFEEEVFGGAIPCRYFPTMETGLRECMQYGLLADYKIVNIKAALLDGRYHNVDSGGMTFRLAAHPSYKADTSEAKPILLEPIVNITVKVPDEFTSTIIGDFNKRRGAIMGMDMADGYQEITAQILPTEVQKYPIKLRVITRGHGVYTQSFGHYEPVPSNVVGGIIAQHKKEEEE